MSYLARERAKQKGNSETSTSPSLTFPSHENVFLIDVSNKLASLGSLDNDFFVHPLKDLEAFPMFQVRL